MSLIRKYSRRRGGLAKMSKDLQETGIHKNKPYLFMETDWDKIS